MLLESLSYRDCMQSTIRVFLQKHKACHRCYVAAGCLLPEQQSYLCSAHVSVTSCVNLGSMYIRTLHDASCIYQVVRDKNKQAQAWFATIVVKKV